MNKIESARIIVKNKGKCHDVLCEDCFRLKKCNKDGSFEEYLIDAESYIKRHEGKSRKKDHIRDTTKKVEEPKPVEEPTPLEIAKMIRDNGYVINCKDFSPNGACGSCTTDFCDHILSKEKARASIKKIDDYISANEPQPVKADSIIPKFKQSECDEEPQPIRFEDPVPEYVYYFNGISTTERIAVDSLSAYKKPDSFVSFAVDVIGRTYPLTDCYRTPEEALQVAKKMWEVEE